MSRAITALLISIAFSTAVFATTVIYMVSRREGAWCTRYPPLGERRKRFEKEGGEKAAAFAAIRVAWQDYIDANGLEHADCPIGGLF